MSANLDFIKNELRTAQDQGTPIRQDLYQHLTEVFNRIMLHHPNDGFDRFETISKLVKWNNYQITNLKTDDEVNAQERIITNKQALELIEKAQSLLDEKVVSETKASAQRRGLLFQENKCVLPNFVEQAETLEWAGIGFGQDTSYLIQKSLKRLAASTGASELRFFGKIFG